MTSRRVASNLGAFLVFALLAGIPARALAQAGPHGDHALGKVAFPVSCSERAQAEFDRAVALLHHMTYPAREATRQPALNEARNYVRTTAGDLLLGGCGLDRQAPEVSDRPGPQP